MSKQRKPAMTFKTEVIAVHDGDTISILHIDGISDTVRLLGIDAPEILQPDGTKAQKFLSDLVLNKTVEIETTYRDDHGRLLGRVLIEGLDVNLFLLQSGMAWLFYPKTLPKA